MTTQRESAVRAYLILVAASAAFAAATTTYEINFANFLRERYHIGEWFRGFLEFPRESQGFAMVFYVVLLAPSPSGGCSRWRWCGGRWAWR